VRNAIRVLPSARRRRACPDCKRVVTAGRRHKTYRGFNAPWCVPDEPGEREAKDAFVRAHGILAGLAVDGRWAELLAASRAVLKARGET
jgi:hypothetical protein